MAPGPHVGSIQAVGGGCQHATPAGAFASLSGSCVSANNWREGFYIGSAVGTTRLGRFSNRALGRMRSTSAATTRYRQRSQCQGAPKHLPLLSGRAVPVKSPPNVFWWPSVTVGKVAKESLFVEKPAHRAISRQSSHSLCSFFLCMAGDQQRCGKRDQLEEWYSQAPVHFRDCARGQQKAKSFEGAVHGPSHQRKPQKRLPFEGQSGPGGQCFW